MNKMARCFFILCFFLLFGLVSFRLYMYTDSGMQLYLIIFETPRQRAAKILRNLDILESTYAYDPRLQYVRSFIKEGVEISVLKSREAIWVGVRAQYGSHPQIERHLDPLLLPFRGFNWNKRVRGYIADKVSADNLPVYGSMGAQKAPVSDDLIYRYRPEDTYIWGRVQ